MLVHLDYLIGMDDGQVEAAGIVFGKLSTNNILIPHQINAKIIFAGGLHRSQYNLAGRFVAAHRIKGNIDACAHASLPPGSPMVDLTRSTSLFRSNGL